MSVLLNRRHAVLLALSSAVLVTGCGLFFTTQDYLLAPDAASPGDAGASGDDGFAAVPETGSSAPDVGAARPDATQRVPDATFDASDATRAMPDATTRADGTLPTDASGKPDSAAEGGKGDAFVAKDVNAGPCSESDAGVSTLLYCVPNGLPYALTIPANDPTHLYFTDKALGTVSRLDLTQAPYAVDTLKDGLSQPAPITSTGNDGGHIYFGTEGAGDAGLVGTMGLDGGGFASTSAFMGTGARDVNGVAFSAYAGKVFFTTYDTFFAWTGVPGATPMNVLTSKPFTTQLGPVAVFDKTFNDYVFWGVGKEIWGKFPSPSNLELVADGGALQGGGTISGEPAGIALLPPGTNTNPTIAWTIAGSPGYVVLTSGFVAGDAGTAASPAVSTAISVPYASFGIATDGQRVYFSSHTGVRALLPGETTAPTLENTLDDCDYGVAVDSTYVYFACNSATVGKIYRTVK